MFSLRRVLVVALAGVVAGCSAPEPERLSTTTSSPPEPYYQHYVALGDSYAAMGSRSAPTTGPAACVRSADNYPAVVAQHPRVRTFVDVTCSSAVTADILNPRVEPEEEIAPQLDSLSPGTELVSLSIGGNDIDFPGVAQCFQDAIFSGGQSACAQQFAGVDVFAGLDESVRAVHEAIRDRAPEARVVVTGYMPLISADGACEEAAFVSPEDREWAVALTADINARLAATATEYGATFVLPDDAQDHTACAPAAERWTDITGLDTDGYPMHPTPLGQQALGEAIKDAL